MARTLLVHRRDGNVVPEVAFQTRSPRHHEKSESLKWDHREVDPVTGSFQNHGDPKLHVFIVYKMKISTPRA